MANEITRDDTPVNLAGMGFHPVNGYTVAQYHDTPDGTGPPSQVHFLLNVPSVSKLPIIVRLKSAGAIDALIAALIEHREGVWGKKNDAESKGA